MRNAFGYLLLCLLVLGCTKSDLEVPELEPEFFAKLEFADGHVLDKKAGLNGYYLFTDGYTSLGKKVYSSTLSDDKTCQDVCSEKITVELHQGDEMASFLDLDQLNFLSTNDQRVLHDLTIEQGQNDAFNHIWSVEGEPNTEVERLALNQNLGNENQLNVTLKYQSLEGGLVYFKQSFQPLKSDNYGVRLEMEKNNGMLKVKVLGQEIKAVRWADGEMALERTFEGRVQEWVSITTVHNQNITSLISIDEGHPSFAATVLGYDYANLVMPEVEQRNIKEVEIIYEDQNGLVYRSSVIDQILPHRFSMENIEKYIDNENGVETYRCRLDFSCILRNTKTNKTIYIKKGNADFAFVKMVN